MRTFSFKGMTNKIFGQEAPEQREARLNLLEELIAEGEEAVKDKTAESEWVADESSCKRIVFIDDDDVLLHMLLQRVCGTGMGRCSAL